MLSRALIVCLLALFCLQITFADRLNTRIASPFVAQQGQFPYIVSLQYTYPLGTTPVTYQATGIIYSNNSIITTANVFNNFPAGGAVLTIGAGAFDLTQAAQVISFNASVSRYNYVANGTTPAPVPANATIVLPTPFVAGSSSDDIAVVRIPAPATFDFSSPEIKIANFPTSSAIPSETIYAVAYGNQGPNSPVFPGLKFARLRLKQNNRCTRSLTANNVTRPFNPVQNFCVASQLPNATNGTFNGVCASDVGGAIVRDGDITSPNNYYEVLGLISYAGDNTTCNPNSPAPVIVSYLSVYYNGFISPILGTLAAAGNGQNATANPNSGKGNFVCGNGVIDTSYEKCEGATNQCCNPWTCSFRTNKAKCNRPLANTTINRCLTRGQCFNGVCVQTPRPNRKKSCAGKNTKCVNGVCNRCISGTCTPIA